MVLECANDGRSTYMGLFDCLIPRATSIWPFTKMVMVAVLMDFQTERILSIIRSSIDFTCK